MKTALYHKWVEIVADEKHVDDDPFISAMNSFKYGFNHWGCLVEAIIQLYPNSSGLAWHFDRHDYEQVAEDYNLYIPLYLDGKECDRGTPPNSVLHKYAISLVHTDAFDERFEKSGLTFLEFLEHPDTQRYLCLT